MMILVVDGLPRQTINLFIYLDSSCQIFLASSIPNSCFSVKFTASYLG